jgi:molybdenum cofactor biosynthesis enzyme MoaA
MAGSVSADRAFSCFSTKEISMNPIYRSSLLAATCLALALIAPAALAKQASSNAKSACMVAVNKNYGGKVTNLRVVKSEFSQANSEVMVDADGERWRCLVSNDGVVKDLSMKSSGKTSGQAAAAGDSTGNASSAAKSACMVAVNKNYGGKVKNLRVVRSEFSQANSEVIVEADGERWRCLASNDGNVQDLSVQ